MLRSFRESIKGTTGKIILAIIIVPFIGFGAFDLVSGGGGAGSVADVNGQEIDQAEFLQTLSMTRNRIASQMGEDADFSQLTDERLAPSVREQLIQSKLIEQFSSRMSMTVPNTALERAVVETESFQDGGRYSNERMQMVLAQSGLTLTGIKQLFAGDIRQNQLVAGLAGSAFSAEAEIDLLLAMTQETRTINSTQIDFEALLNTINIEEQELNAFYETRQDDFSTPFAVDVDYILLDTDALRPSIDEQAILDEYAFRKAQYESVETREVAHIMLEVNSERSEAEAREQLTDIKSRLAAGAEFSDLARELSEDSGSAELGGDLGQVEQDGTFPPEFEEALFALNEGEVSVPVVTEAGAHLIKAVSVNRSQMASLDALRDEIVDQLQLAEATKRYIQLKEELADLVFNAEGLSEPAAALNLNVQTFQKMSQLGVGIEDAQAAPAFLRNNAVIEALFSEELMEEGLNSELVEIDAKRSIVVSVVATHAPRQRALEEVKDAVANLYRREQVAKTLASLADEAEKISSEGQPLESFANDKGYVVKKDQVISRQSSDFDPDVLASIFAAPRSSIGKAIYSATTANGDLVLYELQSVNSDANAAEQLRELLSSQTSTLIARRELMAVYSGLEKRAEIVIHE